jgi:hypothetical protein
VNKTEKLRWLATVIHNVAKAGGLQSQGVKGEIVVGYLDPLITQDLKSSGFPDVLGRSSKSEAQRVNNMAKDSTPSYEFTFVLGRG